ncbi:MAG: nitrous oxidase accessory protein [Marinoscillum sp.]|jgi:nitrous oxidase accessory protein
MGKSYLEIQSMKNLLLSILLIFIIRISYADKIEICDGCSIKSIAEAVEISQPHDTIFIKKGTYVCFDLALLKPIHIIGEEGAILDGQTKGYILKLLADSISISGLKFINSGRSYTKDYAAIYASRVRQFKLINNEIVNPYFGILLEKSHYGLISGNKVHGAFRQEVETGNGIHTWHCSNLNIVENEVFGLRDGIYLEFAEESSIKDNYTHENARYGLHFMFSNHNEYIGNTFQDNGAGVAVMFSKVIVMKGNTFIKNWGTASYGLLLKEIYDAEVTNNRFQENTIGIFIEGCNRINYTSNHFEQNGWAVKVSGGGYGNVFMRNNFVINSFDVSYNTKMNDNKFEGNYWSSYAGYDLDKNDIGDVPYRPVKLFSYIVNQTPETIILLRSLFVDIINFSERVSPVFTPDKLVDQSPAMTMFTND